MVAVGVAVSVGNGVRVGVSVDIPVSSVGSGGLVGITAVCAANNVAATLVATISWSFGVFIRGKLHAVSTNNNKPMTNASFFINTSFFNFYYSLCRCELWYTDKKIYSHPYSIIL